MSASQRATALPSSTLIICTRNRPDLLRETVESVLQGDEVPSELIIVDQSDVREPTLSDLVHGRPCRIRHHWCDSVGLCLGRNVGIAGASHDILAFIDDDVRVAPTWYGALVRAVVEAGPRAAVTGRVLPGPAESPSAFVLALAPREEPRVYRGRIGTDVLAGCHMAMYRSVFQDVGGFDERMSGAEDNDLGFRLLEAGYRIVFAPQALIYHRSWRGGRDYLPMRWAYGRAKGEFYAKYASLRDPYLVRRMVGDVALRVVRFPWRFLHRPRLALGDLAYCFGIVAGGHSWLLDRRSRPRGEIAARAWSIGAAAPGGDRELEGSDRATSASSESSPSLAHMRKLPPSSLIICSRDRPDLLAETVASVLEAEDVPAELVIVDQSASQHPTLGSLSTGRPCLIRYVWNRSVGSSLARNLGAASARHDILAFLDDDERVSPTWYGPLIEALLTAGPGAAVTGRVLPATSEKSDGFVVSVHEWEEPRVYAGRIGRDVLATGHMALYRAALGAVGGLDERLGPGTRFPGAEDNDLGFRLLEAGYRIIYVPGSVVYHRAWRARRDYVSVLWRYGRGQGAYYAKHLTLKDPYMLRRLGGDVRRYLRLLPRRLARRQMLELAGGTAWVLGAFSGALGWSLRQRSQGQ